MSLQKCIHCKKHISWWKIYKKLNEKRIYNDRLLNCPKCNYQLGTKKKKINLLSNIFNTLAWMTLPILLITLVAINKINFIIAILIVTIYHFLIMAYYISFHNYTSAHKK